MVISPTGISALHEIGYPKCSNLMLGIHRDFKSRNSSLEWYSQRVGGVRNLVERVFGDAREGNKLDSRSIARQRSLKSPNLRSKADCSFESQNRGVFVEIRSEVEGSSTIGCGEGWWRYGKEWKERWRDRGADLFLVCRRVEMTHATVIILW